MYKRKILLLASVLPYFFLLNCSHAPNPEKQMTFDRTQPFPLYVASYEIQNRARESVGFRDLPAGNFITPPDQAVESYLHNRFSSIGTQGKLVALIEEATVVHDLQNSDNSIGAALGVDRKDLYNLNVRIKLTALGLPNFERKETTIRANRVLSVSEHVSLAERERLEVETLDRLLDDIDAALQKTFAENFQIIQ